MSFRRLLGGRVSGGAEGNGFVSEGVQASYDVLHFELQRLLDATGCCERPRCKLQPCACRMLILLLYAAGLRISEALSLQLTDVDLSAGILMIGETGQSGVTSELSARRG